MKNIALYFGSFNCIHNTHIKVAEYVSNLDFIDEVQFVVSPQNPFKNDLALFEHRYNMCQLVAKEYNNITVNSIESTLTIPSYTINALNSLSTINNNNYYIIVGLDIWMEIDKWKSCDIILEKYPMLILPRDFDITKNIKSYEDKKQNLCDMNFIINKDTILLSNFKVSNLSSTEIRNKIKNDYDISDFVPPLVKNYISKNKLYK